MTTDRITITAFRGVDDSTAGKPTVLSWSNLVERLAKFTHAESKRSVSGWAPATIEPVCACADEKCPGARGHRLDGNVTKVYALVLDLDKKPDGTPLDQATADTALARLAELGHRRIVHTTHSHAPPTHISLRVVLALSRAVTVSEWPAFWAAAVALLTIHVETSCRNPARFWYAPSCPPNAEPWSQAFDGAPIDVDAILAISASKPATKPKGTTNAPRYTPTADAFDVDAFMAASYPGVESFTKRGYRCWDIECPWEHEHTPDSGGKHDTVVSVGPDGKFGFCCQHGHCKDVRHWEEFRKWHQPDWVPFDERPTNGAKISNRDDREAPPPSDEDLSGGSRPPDAPPNAGSRLKRWRNAEQVAEQIVTVARTPRLSFGFPTIDRVAPFLAGQLATVIGPTGRGKSAFVFQVARWHATNRGPVGIVSAELALGLAGARMIGQETGRSWIGIFDDPPSVEEMTVTLRGRGSEILWIDEVGKDVLEDIRVVLEHFSENEPERPALIVVDYVQLLPGDSKEKREQVEKNVVALRKLVAAFQAGGLLISKGGRGAMKAARSGEMSGVEATEAGSETNAIEHEASVLLMLGEMKPERADAPDGPAVVDVSIVKARFGRPDTIVPLRADLARGRFEELGAERGAAVSASDRRATKKAELADRTVTTLELAIEAAAGKSDIPLSAADLKKKVAGGGNDAKQAALIRLTESDPPRLVPVCGDGIKKRGGVWPLWTPERVAKSSTVRVVPKAVLGA